MSLKCFSTIEDEEIKKESILVLKIKTCEMKMEEIKTAYKKLLL